MSREREMRRIYLRRRSSSWINQREGWVVRIQ
jgi:hypothetical protein